jgi:hypothetical protein
MTLDMSSRINVTPESEKPPARTPAEGFFELGLMNRNLIHQTL